MKIKITIADDLNDTRLDTVITNYHKACSRNRAVRLINNNDILVNKQRKKPGFKIKSGDIITGIIPDANGVSSIAAPVLPENTHLDIQFEDDHIIVINKKPGIVVHPAPGNQKGTIVNALLFHDPRIKWVGKDPSRSGIVHRLDKNTSGLMVVAKTKAALCFLQKEFRERRVVKKYLALVSGKISDDEGEVNLPIGRHPVKRKIMAINYKNGKSARTCWKVLKRFKTGCLVEVLLKTGRTHQIRVHFYAIDHPLIGDTVYQHRRYRKKKNIALRQMLHSWQLSFRHPYSGKRIFCKAEPPADFLQTVSLFEKIP